MIHALASGTLHGAPVIRAARNGDPFTTAKIRSGDGKEGAVWVSIIAFGELAERLAALHDKAAVAVSGKAELSAWLDKAGEPRAGLSLVVDELIALPSQPERQQQRRPPKRAWRDRATATHVAPEKLARELGVLKDWEEVRDPDPETV